MNKKILIYLSIAISIAAMATIGFLWHRESLLYVPNPEQLTDNAMVESLLEKRAADREDDAEPEIHIPTGIFIQSFKFTSASNVNMTGYIWQKYNEDISADISRGFVFPEQVHSGNTFIEEAYRRKSDGVETIGWYFDVTFQEPFDYSKYPLDKHTIWIRMWHKDFDRNVILTPDIDSYDSVLPGVMFGVDRDIVPGGWSIHETYFDYKSWDYDTNFGIDGYIGKHAFPELCYNLTVGRKFMDAFIVHLIPVIIVILMLFSILLTSTREKGKQEVFGFTTSGAISAAAALFFVVTLAHIQIREQFSGVGIVYMEQFYLVTYAAILLASLNIYLFSIVNLGKFAFLHRSDNFITKITFLPMILMILVLITLAYF